MFYPNKRKASPKTGKIPLYLRVTLDREKAESRLNAEILPKELSKWDGNLMRFRDREMSHNILLNSIDTKFDHFKHNNSLMLGNYNAKGIRDILLGLDQKPVPKAVDFIQNYYEKTVEPNHRLADGTKRNYRKALKHFREFLFYRGTPKCSLKEVNMVFANEFKDYLLTITKPDGQVGMQEQSALDNVKRLRTIIERAVDDGHLQSNPFKKIKLKNKSAPRVRLDINQVRQLYNLNLNDFPVLNIYRDVFIFSVFTGLAYADAYALKQTDLNVTKEGFVRLFLQRIKTDVITEMILPQHALAIIEKYKHSPEIQITRNVLPRRSNKEVNVQLKILASMVNIPLKLSTHTARHTFRQLLAEADIYETGVIKRMMGHSRGGEIDGIYYHVTESRLMEAKRKFELFLNKSLL